MAFKTFRCDELQNITEKHTRVIVKNSGTGKILVTEYGGRVFGLFPSSALPNTLWVAPDLDDKLRTNDWLIGGDRLWIAPERHFYYENPRDFDGFHVPAGIDPGEYAVSDDIHLQNRFSLLHYQNNETYDNTIMSRDISMLDDPYGSGLDFVGIGIQDYISAPMVGTPMCAWSIAQVYTCGKESPGTALFPIAQGASMLDYFSPVPPARKTIESGYARFKVDAAEIYKVAVRPEDMLFSNPAKALYISPFPGGRTWFCLVKRSNDLPRTQDDCVDYPKSNPSGEKGVIQSYNHGPGPDSGEVAAFGEIELQLFKRDSSGRKDNQCCVP